MGYANDPLIIHQCAIHHPLANLIISPSPNMNNSITLTDTTVNTCCPECNFSVIINTYAVIPVYYGFQGARTHLTRSDEMLADWFHYPVEQSRMLC